MIKIIIVILLKEMLIEISNDIICFYESNDFVKIIDLLRLYEIFVIDRKLFSAEYNVETLVNFVIDLFKSFKIIENEKM